MAADITPMNNYLKDFLPFVTLVCKDDFPDFEAQKARVEAKMESFILQLIERASSQELPLENSHPKNRKMTNQTVNFIWRKIGKYQEKRKLMTNAFWAKSANNIGVLFSFIKQTETPSAYSMANLPQLEHYIDERAKEFAQGDVRRLTSRIKALDAALTRMRDVSNRMPNVTMEKMEHLMEKHSATIDEKDVFSEYCKFDYCLYSVLANNGLLMRIDSEVSQILSNYEKKKKHLDCATVSQMVTSFMLLLKPKTIRQHTLALSALSRFFFDRLFIRTSHMLDVSPEFYQKLTETCASLRKNTPEKMAMTKGLFPAELRSQSFDEIIKSSSILTEAVGYCSQIGFYGNSVDIAASLFSALKLVEEFVGSFGHTDLLCFDDLVTFICQLIAQDPPPNAIQLSRYMQLIEGFPFPQNYDFARSIFVTATAYIEQTGGFTTK